MSKPVLELTLKKTYPEFVIDLELTIEAGEFFSLLGPSGCGKTTLLRLIAGLEKPDRGSIILNGRDITNLSPDKRCIGLVFQNYALFPHLNVFENIEYGLKLQKNNPAERREKVKEMLSLFQLETLAKRTIMQLSGGEQQRVALARALITGPEILLLDEPFSALDYEIRSRLRDELKQYQQRLRFTSIFVTHQQEEAISVSDRIALMRQGRLIQVGKPREVYQQPISCFGAVFLGDANLIPCRLIKEESEAQLILFDGQKLTVVPEGYNEKDLQWLMIRPEDVKLNTERPQFEGEIVKIEYLGPFYRLELITKSFRIKLMAGKEAQAFKEGNRAGFSFDMKAIRILKE